MEIIPNHVLNNLIALGRVSESDNAERRQLFDSLKPFDSCGRTHANAWISGTDKFNAEQLSALVRGLVLAEEFLTGWNGGTVSGIIWIFQAFQKKAPEKADELANWILHHSTNSYVPFGVNRRTAKSVAEFESYQKAKEMRRTRSEKHAEAEQLCKKIRENVTRRLQQGSIAFQKAKAQARMDLINKLNSLTQKERLEHIAWDDEHDLTFYPVNYSEVTSAEFNSLDEISRERLILKLKSRQKGCWSELFARVTK